MKKHVFKHVLIGLAAAAGFGAVTMLLWNWLMPCIFGLTAINFWQAFGLLVLARLLFGGFGPRRGGGGMKGMRGGNPIRSKWMKMTPEQRKEFIYRRREHMQKGYFFGGGFDSGCDSPKYDE